MEFKTLNSVAQLHQLCGLPDPEHPLVSVLKEEIIRYRPNASSFNYVFELYVISFKTGSVASAGYGRNMYDFDNGTLVFVRPGHVYNGQHLEKEEPSRENWTLCFHPDLIRDSELGRIIETHSFFSYDVEESLHLSDPEKRTLEQVAQTIKQEYSQSVDSYTYPLIIANIVILLNYCSRYFDRQFQTRTKINKGIVTNFEAFLKAYFNSDQLAHLGLPTVQHCGKELGLSPNYLSDLLKKDTGRNAQDHIYAYFIDKAKTLLLSSSLSVKQIAYALGFDYPQHFSKLFKTKTGLSPSAYRNSY